MKALAFVVILLPAICIPMLLAQSIESGSTQSSAAWNSLVLHERNLAAIGNADAEVMLGMFYQYGMGAPQDYTQAAAWYRKAAEQDDPGAQLMLGGLYQDGEGVPQDYGRAYFWLDLALARRSSLVQTPPDNASQPYKNMMQSLGAKLLPAAVIARDEAASHLTRAELLSVQKSAENWLQSHKRPPLQRALPPFSAH